MNIEERIKEIDKLKDEIFEDKINKKEILRILSLLQFHFNICNVELREALQRQNIYSGILEKMLNRIMEKALNE